MIDTPDSESWRLTGATSTGVDPRLAAILSYAAWWLSGLVFLIIEQQHRGVRFHAAQSLVLFGGLFVVIVLLSMLNFGMLMVSTLAFEMVRVLVLGVWIVAVVLWLGLMVRALQGETWRVPFVAEIADKIVGR